jgi:isoleucyl-tRNA synthetase
MFEPFEKNPQLADEEMKILDFWDKNKIFYQSCQQREGMKEFVFYDGPPFATGLPHQGHLLVSTIKDIVARYATMQGFHVRRRFGWDCHGLPVEYEIEKELKISGKKEIENFGVHHFNEKCRSIVLRYSSQWRQTIKRLGRWVDFDDEYHTMDLSYMESVWWVFHQLWDKKLIYQGHRIQPYCPRCCTPLSNFETGLGYRDRQDPSITVTCPSKNEDLIFLVWTTTPWTLPANAAICVGPDIDYNLVEYEGKTYVVAAKRRQNYFKNKGKILSTLKGQELTGRAYRPLFDYFQQMDLPEKTFTVLADDYVSDSNGSGIVHQAPAFGEDDYRVALREGLPLWDPFDNEIIFQDPVSDFKGLGAKEADKAIVKKLKEKGRLFLQDTLEHSYPHCWRCETPLIYRALKAWFMNITPLKEKMIANNQKIHWVPEHLKSGRFGKWLENARDWNLSRNRYWGTPIPVWLCSKGHSRCLTSKEELEKLSGKKIDDLHKHHIDSISFPCPDCHNSMHRCPEVLDCWFESGAMPYAQLHYPFENRDYFQKTFPANFIAEAMDQTRGWFYSLTVLASALFDKPAFKNVIVNGLLLAEDGKKMSKSKRNYTDPDLIMKRYGADAFRLALINSAVVRGEAVRFGDKAVNEALRSVILPLINSCQFFLTYAKADRWMPSKAKNQDKIFSSFELDRWILSRFQSLVKKVQGEMENYQLNRMFPALFSFLDDLTNWYIRRSRRRFWKSENDSDKNQAYQTLHYVLLEFLKTLAPLIPFVTELLYQKLLQGPQASESRSVHLCDYPQAKENLIDQDLERRMNRARCVVTLGHSLRKEHELRVRQPLQKISIVARSDEEREDFSRVKDLILEELNVKEIQFTENEENFVSFSTRPNFKTLGKRLGPKLKTLGPFLKKLSQKDIRTLETGQTLTIEGEIFSLEDILIDRQARKGLAVASFEGVTVALDTCVSDALRLEGQARELINRLQMARKEQGLDVADRVALKLQLPETLHEAFQKHRQLICHEILATESDLSPETFPCVFEIEEKTASCLFSKIS